MTSLQDEAERFLDLNPDVTHLDAFIIDICGRAVGKRYPRDAIAKLYQSGSQLCAATYLLDVRGDTSDPLGHGFSDGDPDADAWPVPGTLKPVAWSEGRRGQCLTRLYDTGTSNPVWFEPQHILEGVIACFAELRLKPVVAIELEFYLIDRHRDEEGAPQFPRSPRTGQRVTSNDVFDLATLDEFAAPIQAIETAARAAGLPVTTALSEFGAGQFEINLSHSDDPLQAATDAAILRRIVQEAVRSTGFDATFMSKPFADQSGSGCQVHVSVLDEAGSNIFDPARADGDNNLGHAVAGFQAMLAESMAIFAPDFNAFRRFQPDQFTPVTRDWGFNNRSMAFRVPASDGANRRIEHRAAGAEANPYLVMAAVLAGLHHGLAGKLEPTPAATGNAGASVDPALPLTIWDALARLREAPLLSDYFSARYVEAYWTVKQAEFQSFMNDIHPREWHWYL